ncbi:lipid A 4'-phosphatase LpxF [Francisella frigiditurris]|uniref:PAP2 superfamily protein n=1 Tax=Francisella frigiditurris TaxID=1542390 RepID=A0A1J0KS03_9GAMM|nr:lipid A 4'-phosphatase LpxF [Francisella frigiditurris]APC96549.1 PAP2 superfamily protein [Francisella frigiditurris]
MARFHIILGFVVCFFAWVFFLCFPHLDITLASNFYNSGDNLFTGQSVLFFTFLNKFVRIFPIVFSILVALFLLGSIFIKVWQTKYRKEIFFVLICLIVGPGLIVNTIFKDHWGRPRPQMVKQFDGDKNFQQPFVISSECSSNCSFVCGDASVGFWLFALMPLMATRKKRAIAFSVAILAGGGLGLMRMAQGGHFFSDVIFCGIFVYISTWVIYAIMYRNKLKKS